MPRKLLDVGRLHTLGWRHRIELREGIAMTYDWFVRSSVQQPMTAADRECV
jgi:GDP-L-fucose synthase